jgi:hypothetical protein
MTDPTARMREAARQKADKVFHTWESRTQLVKDELAAASAASDAKTARLRALRLARDEAEKAAMAAPAESAAPRPRARRINVT